jgi:Flp pilus assembly protein TadB
VFVAVFSVFVLAMVVLSVLTIRWAVKRDRERRAREKTNET